VTVLLSNGDGTFTAAPAPTAPNNSALTVGDFNGDGKPDIAAIDFGNNTVTILLGNGNGTFTAAPSLPTGQNPTTLAAGDFTGNGKSDLAVGTSEGNSSLVVLTGD